MTQGRARNANAITSDVVRTATMPGGIVETGLLLAADVAIVGKLSHQLVL
jgi:hypothetical protein